MLNKEDIECLVKHFESHATDDPALDKVYQKLVLLKKQIDLQAEFQEKSLGIRKEFEELDKKDQ